MYMFTFKPRLTVLNYILRALLKLCVQNDSLIREEYYF